MNYAIIENEQISLENLRREMERLRPEYHLLFTANSVAKAVDLLDKEGGKLDLMFVDIELNDGNCFELFRRTSIDVPVIFTTAYDEYAIQAFTVNSVDYLLKPIYEDDLERAINKFEAHNIPKTRTLPQIDLTKEERTQATDYRKRILTMSGERFFFINTSDIAFLTSEEKYVVAYDHKGHSSLTTLANMSEAAETLDPAEFFQLTRNIITSTSAIKKVERFFKGRLKVELQAGQEKLSVTVSSARRKNFLDWLGNK